MNDEYRKCNACSNYLKENGGFSSGSLAGYFALFIQIKTTKKLIPKIPTEFHSKANSYIQELDKLEKEIKPHREEILLLWQKFIKERGGELPLNLEVKLCSSCSQALGQQEKTITWKIDKILDDNNISLNKAYQEYSSKVIDAIGQEKFDQLQEEAQSELEKEMEDYIKSVLNKQTERERERESKTTTSTQLSSEPKSNKTVYWVVGAIGGLGLVIGVVWLLVRKKTKQH